MVYAVLLTVLAAIATARATRLLAADRVTLPLRAAVVRRFGPSSALGYLVHCRWCVSMYLGPLFAAATIWLVPLYHHQPWPQRIVIGTLLALAYSHVTALLASLEADD